ncbi:MAG: hypothetical protein E5X68_31280 [Mesorhizobium sp.]|nr:MAG: hypothetical protein EOQ84_31160 [Mesorhizobium sp.]RWK29580.1 MAG: hypothetical protein EOR40_27015 [Mesorhizobium sp.]RWL21057.1 MAG: hypothetical protein EOR58_30000 [Mesorhizobium sp.]RWL24166.1 MAG: hypothetical protein EOR63_30680 [Mesorhizobium sp.]RWL29293.1 MAG: hypothetical protein EOR59_30250 [Mesorhizobium sp.]
MLAADMLAPREPAGLRTFFQPSSKLTEKERDGARVRKRPHPSATPCQRLLNPRTLDCRARSEWHSSTSSSWRTKLAWLRFWLPI